MNRLRLLAFVSLFAVSGVADAATFPFKGSDGTTYTGYAAGPLATFASGQVKVAATATAMASTALVNGVTLCAKSGNTGTVFIGTSSSVNTTFDGTGNGFGLAAGGCVTISVTNTSAIYSIGTANDVFTWVAN